MIGKILNDRFALLCFEGREIWCTLTKGINNVFKELETITYPSFVQRSDVLGSLQEAWHLTHRWNFMGEIPLISFYTFFIVLIQT